MGRLPLRKREEASWGKLTEYNGEVIHGKKEVDRASGLQKNNPGNPVPQSGMSSQVLGVDKSGGFGMPHTLQWECPSPCGDKHSLLSESRAPERDPRWS